MSRFGLQGIFIFLTSFVLVACDSGEDNVLNNLAPEALNVSIVDNNGGTIVVGDTLTGSYTYEDPEGDNEGQSIYRWLRNGKPIGSATSRTYTLVTADGGQTITFEVTPVAELGTTTGVAVTSAGVTVEIPNSAPVARAVSIKVDNGTGIALVGDVLIGNYVYTDTDGDAEGVTTFQWLRDGAPIDGATDSTYTLVTADSGNSIAFEVTPVAATGVTDGDPVISVSAIVINNSPPTAIDVIIKDDNGGLALVGDALTGVYTFVDVDGNLGDVSTYQWYRGSPVGSAIPGATTLNYTLTADDSGQTITFEVTPIATAGTTLGLPVTSPGLDVSNSPPVADAGPDQTALVTDTVTLDGSASTDVDRDSLSYSWTLTTKPADSTTTLSLATTANPTLFIDKPGTYIAQLIVNDGTVNSVADTVTINTDNSAPVADAGPDQTALVTDTVTLDGSASSDVDGDSLSYSWTLTTKPADSTATLSLATTANPTLSIDKPGTYIAQLIVNDGTVNSVADTVTINTDNSAPVADAGPDQTALVTDTVTLDGSASSDVDGDSLTYSWTLTTNPADSTTTLSLATTANPTLFIDKPGTYVAQLIVNDGTVDSAPVTVNINTDNSAPVADAGPDQSPLVGDTVTLDGSGSSDVDGDSLSYSWTLTTKPADSTTTLSLATTTNPTLFIDKPGTYVAQLIVNDGTVDSASVTVNINTDNSAPVADAGPDQSPLVGDTVTLDGTGSSDVDGDALTYSWTLTAKPADSTTTLSLATTANPTLFIDKPGTYVAQLIVNDGTVDSAPMTVNISTSNSAPVADAGPDQSPLVGDTVTLDGSASSDVDDDSLSYSWTLTTKPADSTTTLSLATTVSPTLFIDKPGTYVAQLIVNDGTVDSAPVTVNINTDNSAPVADAGPAQTPLVGDTVTLDGSGSSDVDGDTLTYSWTLISKPASSTTTLSLVTTANPTLFIDEPGIYVAQLIVNDGAVDSVADTVSINTDNSVPVADAGPDQSPLVGDTVTLDGSGSSDVDGDSLTYSWSLISKPASSTTTLSLATTVNPTLFIDEPGTYVAQLVVNDGTADSAPVTVNINTDNSAPVADAGSDQTALVTDTVTLDGTGSSDVDGDSLSYSWTLTAKPADSTTTLSLATTVSPTLFIDEPGTYVAQLVVNDGTVDSAPVTVNINTDNSAPVADAGPDQSPLVGDTVTLDGSGSSDVDGDSLTYSWSLTSKPASSTTTLSLATTVNPTLFIDEPGTYVAQLVVNDGTADSAPVTVNISTSNSAPVPDAGPDQTALVTDTVTLDGSASSDVDGDSLSYSWTLPTKPADSTTTLSLATTANPTLFIDKPGTYIAQLIVNDGTVNSVADTVTINTDNSAPVADAGPDQTALVTDTVTLDGSASSDVDGDSLSYSWTLTTKPADSTTTLSLVTTANPTLFIDEPGTYIAQLIVNDGTVDSAPVTVNINTDNSAPVADTGTVVAPLVGDTVVLDGSGSSDVDGDTLTYSWSLTSKPASSTATLADATTANPSFVADESGTYIAQLIVNDGTVDSTPATLNISTSNSAPVADAGPDQTALVTDTVTLDGSASSDVDGDSLSYSWTLTTKPADSTATLSLAMTANPTLYIDKPGTYVAQLIVNDGTVDSAPVTVNINTENSAPVADAGPDQTVLVLDTVTLDGSGSTDVDGDTLTYSWILGVPAGSDAVLSDSTLINPTFSVDTAGTYLAQLTVNDGIVNSVADTVIISTTNSAPVADAGPAQTPLVGATVTLNGTGSSDVDGDSLTYSWTLTAKPADSTTTLSLATTASPTLFIDEPGTYVAQLIVNDGTVDSAPVTVDISTSNSVPVADAGPDQSPLVGDTVTLDGSASSDVDGDGLTYSWSLTSQPVGSTTALSSTTIVGPTLFIDEPGTYTVQLIVNDGTVDSAPVTVNINTDNSAPVADAGPDQTPLVGDTVTLDGSASSDVDGDGLNYSWSLISQPSGSTTSLSSTTIVAPTLFIDEPGTYTVQLIVNDGTVDSAPVTVNINTDNSAPVADAGPDQTPLVGDTVTLDGSGSSDVDGDALTYSWSLTSKPASSAATLSLATTANPTLFIDEPGTYVAQLIVNDGTVDSAPVTVNINTDNSAPVADAGPDQTPLVGDTVALDGSASSDVDGDGLTYSWSLTSQPVGSTTTLSSTSIVDPTLFIDQPGTYVVQLIVNDGTVDSAPVTVNISTSNSAPVADAGPDQTVLVLDTVSLDGSASSDVDGDMLTYSWSLILRPASSTATLTNATTATPSFIADELGTYLAQLIVNDGTVSSDPVTVTILAE